MPGEFSVYRKIQVVLDIAKSVEAESLRDLESRIMALRLPNFITRQYDPETDDFMPKVSKRPIRRAVNLSHRLDLIDSTGSLTEEGREALDKHRFNKVVASRISVLLRDSGINLSALNKVILGKLRMDPPVMPTSRELWEASSTEMGSSLFSGMLTLLAHCGGAVSSQRKIYVSIDTV